MGTLAEWNAATIISNASGYRLPTEMEWKWAAMGAPVTGRNDDTDTAGWQKGYAGSTESGNATANIGNYAWYGVTLNNGGKSHEVGKKIANELYLYDMSGNEMEWCWDWHGSSYGASGIIAEAGTVTDYAGPASGLNRVVRGGSWKPAGSNCSVASRQDGYGPSPFYRFNEFGFRVLAP